MERNALIIKYKIYCFRELIKCVEKLSLDEQIHFIGTLEKILKQIFNEEDEQEIADLTEKDLLIIPIRNNM